jgi:hypothetical protein
MDIAKVQPNVRFTDFRSPDRGGAPYRFLGLLRSVGPKTRIESADDIVLVKLQSNDLNRQLDAIPARGVHIRT